LSCGGVIKLQGSNPTPECFFSKRKRISNSGDPNKAAILSQVLLPNAMAEILDRDGVLNEIASKTKVPFVTVCDSWGWESGACFTSLLGGIPGWPNPSNLEDNL